jgi:hypothetical protein
MLNPYLGAGACDQDDCGEPSPPARQKSAANRQKQKSPTGLRLPGFLLTTN